MTIQQLEYVLALDQYRHFVQAATHCRVTQPTLTMQVRKLEDEIGFSLFNRNKKPLEPTHEGKVFIAKSKRIMREINELKTYVQREQDSLSGRIRLGVIPTIAPYLLPRFLPEFLKNYSDIELEIHELQTDQIIDQLKAGDLDMGLLVTSLGEKEIREIPLYHEPFLLYHPKDYEPKGSDRIATSDISTQSLLVLDEGHCFRDQALEICKARNVGSGLSFQYQSGSFEGLMQMVRQGIGYTLVPELALIEEGHSAYTTRFKDPQPVREVSLVVHEGFARDAILGAMRQAIRTSVPREWLSEKNYYRVKWRA